MKRVRAGKGYFSGGWITCANPLCGCHIIYDPKKKKIKATGEMKEFHYYHCTNGKKIHKSMKGMNVSEDNMWRQYGKAIDNVSIPDNWVDEIMNALEKAHDKVKEARRREMTTYREALKDLEVREDEIYSDYKNGILDDDGYKRQFENVRKNRHRYTHLLEQAHNAIDGAYLKIARSTLELAKDLKSLWNSKTLLGKRLLLDKLLSNQTLDGQVVHYHYQKPFSAISNMVKVGCWRPQGDLNPCYRRERAMSWTRLDDGDACHLLVHRHTRKEYVFQKFGEPGWDRTIDPQIKSLLLYP